ncbi:PRC-barrel domain-containing protein [cf. Phormidesmis sp. LEGE 11477]|uniref:PRC-barrel domain-containing protein n=1 Tax=cf. Phormidesmis sp. LEGE 11477 TaxID=1828680 RepID=UPI00187FEFB0|nr:PRC-barrel domain-containing protein [cf. Phormidesmis sp. LEGE 11477]MBE9062057.1 PRC-barrel domain-containing protein [cf. Phormidesmis sp. LEGE 11477]
MTFEQSRLRSDIVGTQVITRSTGRRLGVVSQLWVDMDRLEVLAVGLQENVLSKVIASNEKVMLLSDIRQMGDVILVDDDTVLDGDINVSPFSSMVNSEVITESGEVLGRVRGFKFDVITGKLETVVVASLGLPQIPDQVVSTYELPVEEIVSTGPDRIIVFEGSEEKLVQLSVGLLERLGLASPAWDRGLSDGYVMPTSASNQLPSGMRNEVRRKMQRDRSVEMQGERQMERPREEQRWQEEAPPQREAQREAQREPQGEPQRSQQRPAQPDIVDVPPADVDITGDVWDEPTSPEKEEELIEAKPLNLPKKKVMEYEEESDY